MCIINWQVAEDNGVVIHPHSLSLTPSYLVVRLTQKLGDNFYNNFVECKHFLIIFGTVILVPE